MKAGDLGGGLFRVRIRWSSVIVRTSALVWSVTTLATAAAAEPPKPNRAIDLRPCEVIANSGTKTAAFCGTIIVAEDRALPKGRQIPLEVTVVPARDGSTSNSPVFFMPGGPGQRPDGMIRALADAKGRDHHDYVFVEMRGAGKRHALDCAIPGKTNPQRFLEPIFSEVSRFARCRETLSRKVDLNQYTMPNAMRDVDAVRQALGYRQIIVDGGSYGTRAALVYMRMFPQHVRAAVLVAVAPFENRVPLNHSAAAQRAFNALADECSADAQCGRLFGDIRLDLSAVLERLQRQPETVAVTDHKSGASSNVTVDAGAFADGLRVMLYYDASIGSVPLLLDQARKGDIAPFAQAAYDANRVVWEQVPLGMLLSYTCSEDVARVRPDEIEAATANTFLGDIRIRGQMAACANWARHPTSPIYTTPFRSNIPVLLFSGNLDPVTPPADAEIARRGLPNSRHVVFPGAHGTGGDCLDAISAQFYGTANVTKLDLRCVDQVPKIAFEIAPRP